MTSLVEVLHQHAIDTSQLECLTIGDHFSLYLLPNTAPEPVDLWRQLRALVDQTQHWPVITPDHTLLDDLQQMAHGLPVADLIDQVEHLDIAAWLTEQQRVREELDDDFRAELRRGLLPVEPQPNHRHKMLYDFRTGQAYPSLIVLVPTIYSWRVPLYLQFGAFNRCPEPIYHASMLNYWVQRYQVELVCMAWDSLEVHVPTPPQQPPTAWRLAIEQFAYCDDIDHFYSVQSLTAALLESSVWWFWWD